MSFIPSFLLDNITFYALTIPNGSGSITQAVSCDQDRSAVVFLGNHLASHPGTPVDADATAIVDLSGGNLITVSRQGNGGDLVVSVALIEFVAFYVLSKQDVSQNMSSASPGDYTFSPAVSDKALILYRGQNIFPGGGLFAEMVASTKRLNATTLRCQRLYNSPTATSIRTTVIDLR